MITLNWGQIRNPNFNTVLSKVLRAKMPFNSAKRMLDILTEVRDEQAKSDEMWANVVSRYLEVIPGEPEMMQIRKDLGEAEQAEAKQTIEQFMATPVEIRKAKLLPEELTGVELSALDLIHLQGLIEE